MISIIKIMGKIVHKNSNFWFSYIFLLLNLFLKLNLIIIVKIKKILIIIINIKLWNIIKLNKLIELGFWKFKFIQFIIILKNMNYFQY